MNSIKVFTYQSVNTAIYIFNRKSHLMLLATDFSLDPRYVVRTRRRRRTLKLPASSSSRPSTLTSEIASLRSPFTSLSLLDLVTLALAEGLPLLLV